MPATILGHVRSPKDDIAAKGCENSLAASFHFHPTEEGGVPGGDLAKQTRLYADGV